LEIQNPLKLYFFFIYLSPENKNTMTQEQLRMQMLAGIITEGQYKAKLNEVTVGEFPQH
jgi:hypothetical protein